MRRTARDELLGTGPRPAWLTGFIGVIVAYLVLFWAVMFLCWVGVLDWGATL